MYKKFFLGMLFTAFIVSIFFILVAYFLSNKNVWGDVSSASIVNKHREIAENIDTPKILFIGGSSVRFGINTKLVSRDLNYSAINLGSSVGLRLDYIFYDAKKSIQNNDIVILPLEYVSYHEDKLSATRIVQIWQSDKQYFDKMLFKDKMELLYSIPIDKEIKVIGTNIGIPIKKEDNNVAGMILNENGDCINISETKYEKINVKDPFDESKTYLDENTKNSIIDFLNYCKVKNVKVFVTYPPYYYKQNYFEEYNLEQINKINDFWRKQNVIILGEYTDFIYTDRKIFYDNEYHLNSKGQEKNTEKLIELLKPYINNN